MERPPATQAGAAEEEPGRQIAVLREQLSTFGPLLALSMLLAATIDEGEILRLAISAIPSLAPCQCEAIRLDGKWVMGPSRGRFDPATLGFQLDGLAGRDGPVQMVDRPWAWAFPLVGSSEMAGHVVVSSPSEPEDHQRYLVGVLLQHAGVAVANARLYHRQQILTEELQSANRALKNSVAATELARAELQRSLDIHRQLTQVAASAQGVEGIAQAVRRLTGRSVAVEDRYGNLLAWAGPAQPEGHPKPSPQVRQRLLRRALDAGRPIRWRDRLLWVAHAGQEVFGVIALLDPNREALESDEVVLEHGSTVLMLEMARLRAVAETELRLRLNLVEELLSGQHGEGLLERAAVLGFDLVAPHRVVVAVAEGAQDPDALFHAARRAARDTAETSLLLARNGGVVILCPADVEWEQLRAAVASEYREHGQWRMGVGGECQDPAGYRRSLQEAHLAISLQSTWGGPAAAILFDDLGVYKLFGQMSDPDAMAVFVRTWLGALIDHDADKGGDLVGTISAYVEAGGSYEVTAAALNVHRSTLRYRLNRLRQISGLDLADPDTRFNVQLATRAQRIMNVKRRS